MSGLGKVFRAKCWSSLPICLPQVLSECSLPKNKPKRKVNKVSSPQTTFLTVAFKAL